MTQAEIDLFHESRCKPVDIVDEAIFDPTTGLYYLLQNRCHNDETAFPLAIYHSMTGTTYCYDRQLKQFFFVCPSYCPANTMYTISNKPDIPHYISNTIGIPYPLVPSLAQAADIPPSSNKSMNPGDIQTTLTPWLDQHNTPDTRWDNPTFTTFNSDNTKNIRTQPYPKPPPIKLAESKPATFQFNILTKDYGEDRSKPKETDTNNLLLQLDEQHPRCQELVNINDHFLQNSQNLNSSTNLKTSKTSQQGIRLKEQKTPG